MKKVKNTMGLLLIAIIVMCSFIYVNKNVEAKDNKKEEKIEKKDLKNIYKFRKSENVVFFGDSLTDYYPLDEVYGKDAPIVNSGISGYKTQDLIKNIEDMVYKHNPTKVIILIGINDIRLDTSDENVDGVKKNIEKIVKMIKSNRRNADIYIQSLYPVNKDKIINVRHNHFPDDLNDKVNEINTRVKEICKEYGATYIDMHKHLTNDNGELKDEFTEDGLHINGIGYARITRELIPYVYE